MMAKARWRPDTTRFLTIQEVACVVADLRRKASRSVNTRMNLAVFRLATNCGLRASEIAGLRMKYVNLDIARPMIQVQAKTSKNQKGRKVPIWEIAGLPDALGAWYDERKAQGAKAGDFLVCAQSTGKAKLTMMGLRRLARESGVKEKDILGPGALEALRARLEAKGVRLDDPKEDATRFGRKLDRRNLRNRFRAACACLGKARLDDVGLSIHDGRHSCASHMLAAGFTIAEVRDFLGHSDITVTGLYLHAGIDEEAQPKAVFADLGNGHSADQGETLPHDPAEIARCLYRQYPEGECCFIQGRLSLMPATRKRTFLPSRVECWPESFKDVPAMLAEFFPTRTLREIGNRLGDREHRTM